MGAIIDAINSITSEHYVAEKVARRVAEAEKQSARALADGRLKRYVTEVKSNIKEIISNAIKEELQKKERWNIGDLEVCLLNFDSQVLYLENVFETPEVKDLINLVKEEGLEVKFEQHQYRCKDENDSDCSHLYVNCCLYAIVPKEILLQEKVE